MSDLVCHLCKKPGERTDLFPDGENGRICRSCKTEAAEKISAERFVPVESKYEDASCSECSGLTSRLIGKTHPVKCHDCEERIRTERNKDLRAQEATSHIERNIGHRYAESNIENLRVEPDFKAKIVHAYEAGQSVLFFGDNGTGKTHAAVGIFRLAFIDGRRPLFRLVPDIFDDLRRSFDGGDPRKIIDACRDAKILILDDLGAEKPSEWVVEQLCRIIDWRYRDDAQTIITTNLPPAEIGTTYGSRIYSRIIGLVGKNLLRLKGRDRRQDELKGTP